MCVPHFRLPSKSLLLRQIPVILRQILRATLQMAWFLRQSPSLGTLQWVPSYLSALGALGDVARARRYYALSILLNTLNYMSSFYIFDTSVSLGIEHTRIILEYLIFLFYSQDPTYFISFTRHAVIYLINHQRHQKFQLSHLLWYL